VRRSSPPTAAAAAIALSALARVGLRVGGIHVCADLADRRQRAPIIGSWPDV
jgi:hypothetical protein